MINVFKKIKMMRANLEIFPLPGLFSTPGHPEVTILIDPCVSFQGPLIFPLFHESELLVHSPAANIRGCCHRFKKTKVTKYTCGSCFGN